MANELFVSYLTYPEASSLVHSQSQMPIAAQHLDCVQFVDERVSTERLKQEREEASQRIQDLTCQLQEQVKELAALKSTMR